MGRTVKNPAEPQAQANTLHKKPAVAAYRPTVGDLVKVKVENDPGKFHAPIRCGTLGLIGKIVVDDGSLQPYQIDFGDGQERWYREAWVELVMQKATNNLQQCATDVSEESILQQWELIELCDEDTKNKKTKHRRSSLKLAGGPDEPDVWEDEDSSGDEWMITEIVW
mmetsp:Transcript_11296/g.24893  ORF Transcript_11296/g.24893 Transcript_11296/m.24893 type:complete len:167 (-) Transcript_11296:148-648(-)|eukprot:CAMPEP_0206480912 /NCGR_PEP_ID=MMETSP0324_2-20121206/37752_1 /ASSEMBLY_ACC=CAM_ASM_000836 /TAXON_ID=2866 /ORGANISM="Crypthecodinium cohnii, Strain Seligo" /LENGTH=166 /DNA_ID=CAMNT_0053958141 /DNA_START=120 /DNA_END=617 /DNA_ORIENTATION=+